MGKMMLGWRNRMTDTASVSGGSWLAGLPLTNLLDKERAAVARSSNALTTSTQFTVDFGTARSLRALALLNHNLSLAGAWRVKLGTTPGTGDIYTSAWQAAWFIPFGVGAEEWESNAWWSPADDEWTGHPFMAPMLLPMTFTARYLTVEIDDTGNADGYIQVGRLFAGEVFTPAIGPQYGLQHGWKDNSTVQVMDSGAVFADEKRGIRTVSLDLPWIDLDESAIWSEIQRRSGSVREILYIPNSTDWQETQRYGFCGRLSDLQPQTYAYYQHKTIKINLEEWL